MYTIFGLGNPGAEYDGTRHNVGKSIVRQLKSVKAKIIESKEYMNNSGRAVKSVKNLIVVHDDLDLPLGKIKISFGKSAGGHRGVASVIQALKTKDFIRVRVGISPKKKIKGEEKVIKFILGRFKSRELVLLKKVFKKVTQAIEVIISDGLESAQSDFNR